MEGNAYPPSPGFDGPYYVGAVADPYGNQEELIEDNNALAGYRMGVGHRPDFVVTSVTGPASTESGQHITTQVTVCNRGTQARSTEVEVYLSADADIQANVMPDPTGDAFLGSAYIDYLAPSQCRTVPVEGNAYPPSPGFDGPYYVGAVADPYGNQEELIEDNNALAGYRMGVGHRPDFVVTSVTGPASTESGQHITTQVTVCNRGTRARSTEVEVYLSADADIQANVTPDPAGDSMLGSAPIDYLAPGQCATVPVEGNAYPPSPGFDGPYYVGAVVDADGYQEELIEDNNALAGYRMGVGHRPDFVVTSVTGPSSTEESHLITAQVKVCNQGTQAGSTDVEVYLSADQVIRPYTSGWPAEDYPVGSISTDTLSPGQCATVAVEGNAYPPGPIDAPYYLGAVADPNDYREELIEDNNALASYRMGVGHGPDFVVTSVTGPVSAQSGQAISTQVTVCNQGTAPGNTEVGVYLSADQIIRPYTSSWPAEDYPVGSAPTNTLSPGQCATVPVEGSAYPPGPIDAPYYLGAVADPNDYREELIEDNNTQVGSRVGVGTGADFVITSVAGPASAQSGQIISTQVTVCNQGTAPGNTEVEVLLSADQVIRPYTSSGPAEDSPLGSGSTDRLYPGQCATVSVEGNAYPPGPDNVAYYVGAVADPDGYRQELIEDNNALAGYRMGVGSRADFVITSVTGPYSAAPGASFTVNVGICNRGQQSDTVDVDVFLSADANVRVPTPPGPPEDIWLGTVSSVSLSAGACTTKSLSVTPPSVQEGAYYLGAVADPLNSRQELIEDNNAKAGSVIGLGNKADFVVTTVTGPSSVKPGSTFTANVTVCNRGQQSDTVDVDVYLSADTNVRVPTPLVPPEDFFLGTVTNVPVSVGACTTKSLSVTAPSVQEGAYYLGAVADPLNSRQELIEDNNAKAGNVIGVGNKADFVITAVTGPSSIRLGASFSASITVCNRGQMADTTDVDLYVSADSTVRVPTSPAPPEDFYLGTLSGVSLGVGACSTRSLVVNADVSSTGWYYLGAVADAFNSRSELIEDNNTKVGTFVSVIP